MLFGTPGASLQECAICQVAVFRLFIRQMSINEHKIEVNSVNRYSGFPREVLHIWKTLSQADMHEVFWNDRMLW